MKKYKKLKQKYKKRKKHMRSGILRNTKAYKKRDNENHISFEEGMKMCRREETKKKVWWVTEENTPEPCLTVFDCQ